MSLRSARPLLLLLAFALAVAAGGGAGWVEAVVDLHVTGKWTYPDTDRVDGFSVVLFGPHGPHYRHPPASLVNEVRAMPGISSVRFR